MKRLIIKAKGSNTGSIYDLAQEEEDRVIAFPRGFTMAVALPSYIGGHSVHKSQGGAYRQLRKLKNQGYNCAAILDDEGNRYMSDSWDGEQFTGSMDNDEVGIGERAFIEND